MGNLISKIILSFLYRSDNRSYMDGSEEDVDDTGINSIGREFNKTDSIQKYIVRRMIYIVLSSIVFLHKIFPNKNYDSTTLINKKLLIISIPFILYIIL